MSYIILVGLYFNVSVEAALCAVPKPQTHETANSGVGMSNVYDIPLTTREGLPRANKAYPATPEPKYSPMLSKVAFERVYTEPLFKDAAAPYKRAYHINSDQNE